MNKLIPLVVLALLLSACGDDPISYQRRRDAEMAYLIRNGIVTSASVSTQTVSITATQTSISTVVITKQ